MKSLFYKLTLIILSIITIVNFTACNDNSTDNTDYKYYVTLTPKYSDDQKTSGNIDDIFDNAVEILRLRLDNLGYTSSPITIQGVGDNKEILIKFPETEDMSRILNMISSSGRLSFVDSANTEYLNGDDIKDAYAGYDENGNPIVVLEFTTSGTTKFSNATGKLTGSTMYIKLGDDVISVPTVNEKITSDSTQITGLESYEIAETIAAIIKSGEIDIEFDIKEITPIQKSVD